MTKLADICCLITIDATRERTWTVLTTPAFVQAWLGCTGFVPEVGSLFHMQPDPERRAAGSTEGATHCVIKAIEPPDRLRFSWFLPGTPETDAGIALPGPAEGGPSWSAASCVAAAWELARSEAAPDDLICVTGSFFIAAETRAIMALPADRERPGT